MKKIYITASFNTSITREIEVNDDFDPANANFDDLFFDGHKGFSNEELDCAIQNLDNGEVWLARDENCNEIWHD